MDRDRSEGSVEMRRRNFLVALAGWLATTSAHPAFGQQTKVWRVGLLVGSDRPSSIAAYPNGTAFVESMRQLGYVEGKNLVIEWRFAGAGASTLAQHAAELVKRDVDVIVAGGTRATREAQKATQTIPIVTATMGDALTTGIAASLARPGGNLTGLTSLSVDLSQKQLELIRAVEPGLARVAVLVNPDNPAHPSSLKRLTNAAAKSGVTIVPVEARPGTDLPPRISAAASGGATGIIVPRDPFFNSRASTIASAAASHRLVSIGGVATFAENGGLLSYGADALENYRRAAFYVDKIFKGTKPGDLPIEQPTKFEFVVNARTAKALGLTLPPSVLLQATRLIE